MDSFLVFFSDRINRMNRILSRFPDETENLIDQFYIDLSNMKNQLTTLGYDFRVTELETESGTTFFDDI